MLTLNSAWAFCSGQTLAIADNDVLFNLIGTIYGGDGQTTFQLPDLQDRVPIHQGQGNGLTNRIVGEKAGTENVTLTVNQIPAHSHAPAASTTGGNDNPSNNYWGNSGTGKPYATGVANVAMNGTIAGGAGGSQPHDNMIPFLCVNYIISLFGVFPSQN